ncbi:hypothetical protein NLU13_1208 [Sarocladium strictum]|uniref:DUF202 domain-containing protein n=1 Tax=Sarocladium strictum TaxID=5046 RepID=A0AA39GR97_SARSR|nr:hypothetical protein NLU13_1208 [Sarocladium strictum]
MSRIPNSAVTTDIPLQELSPEGHETASPSADRASPLASSSEHDIHPGPRDTGRAAPNNEPARPGKSSVKHHLAQLARFRATYIRCTVDFTASRDHLAVERTFLGYLRTSSALAMFGTLVAQVFTIDLRGHGLGYTLLGRALATVFFCLAIVTIVLGATRVFRHQRHLIRGKALAGGFETSALGVALLSLLLACFAIILAIEHLPGYQQV